MNVRNWLVAGALAVPMMVTTARADENDKENHPHQKVTMDELPAAVKTTVQRESKGKTVEWMAKEQENGKTVYEVEVVSDGKGQEIEISGSGKVLERHAKHDETNEAERGEK